MSLGKFVKVSFFVTALALVYIHLQMQIIDLAYQGQAKDQKIRQLTEANGNTLYTISKLKSANHLGEVLLAKNSGMQFADPADVVQVTAPAGLLAQAQENQTWQPKPKNNTLLSMLSFATTAEARTGK